MNDKVKNEGVITIRDEQKNLIAIAYKDTSKVGEVVLYKVEKIPFGDMKDFLAELSGHKVITSDKEPK